jgi:hypothetical protein
MSTTTHPDVPAPTSYDSRPPTWRIAEGFFKQGRDKEPGYRECQSLFGQFKAVGISSFTDEQTNEEIHRLWAEFQNQEGRFRISIKLRSAVGAALLGRGLLEISEGEWVGIKTVPSEDKTKKSTRVFLDRWDGSGWKAVKLTREFPGNDSAAKLPGILDAIRALPTFREHKAADKFDYNSAEQWECFAHEAKAAGWPAFEPNKAAYMAWAGHEGVEPPAAPDDLWIGLRKKLAEGAKPPKKLLDQIAASPAANDEYDPFADE